MDYKDFFLPSWDIAQECLRRGLATARGQSGDKILEVQNFVPASPDSHSVRKSLMDRYKEWITEGWHAICLSYN